MKKIFAVLLLIISVLTVKAQQRPATYLGSIKGYTTAWGFKTGKVIINNVITGQDEMYLVNISPDGKFEATIPLKYNTEAWVSFPFFNSTVYFEQGAKVVQDFDVTGPTITSLFKADCAEINNDINKVRTIVDQYNWDKIYADVYELTPRQYKTYFLNIQVQKLAAIDSMAKTTSLSKKARWLATTDIKYFIASSLIYFNSTEEAAYRVKNKIGFNDRAPVRKATKLDSSYYDFLKPLHYNDATAMNSNTYFMFLNRLKFLDLIFDKAERIDYATLIEEYKKKDTTDKNVMATLAHFRNSMNRNATVAGSLDRVRPIVLKSLLKTNITMELELMEMQDIYRGIYTEKIPLSNTTLDSLKRRFKYTSFFMQLVNVNNDVKKEIEESKTQPVYADNQIHAAGADSVFDKIISKYKGKVIFVDFWATWCGPCMQAIQEIAPVKADLNDKDIVFLYIASADSPEKAYNTVIPQIKGEHYRVTAEEYDALSKRFEIHGIPHYAIVNQNSQVVNKDYRWANTEDIKSVLLSLPAK